LVSGARSVLATHWLASDYVFPQLMETFLKKAYQPDQKRLTSKAEALQSALRQHLASKELETPLFKHPIFWASLALLGDGL